MPANMPRQDARQEAQGRPYFAYTGDEKTKGKSDGVKTISERTPKDRRVRNVYEETPMGTEAPQKQKGERKCCSTFSYFLAQQSGCGTNLVSYVMEYRIYSCISNTRV